MTNHFETTYKGDIYVAEIVENAYGGCDLTIHKLRDGRAPKHFLSRHFRNNVEAMAAMENSLKDATWREKE